MDKLKQKFTFSLAVIIILVYSFIIVDEKKFLLVKFKTITSKVLYNH
jgi:hypothetical protein